ncbi:glutamate synthase [Thermacetogenium phaeum DSM 12270]|uniref:glutamate synthase (NADPH) n=1 Tax=Thermacetogenium phaeum (strain ATCC BAA-254 / DSM 26808 / PB) TaxID=1089553 RepID=K4LDK5_THEPS|nr:glutamate synthase-related protein [Thermacetogenium phaeum]AFV11086.1 glutamate synthase [Thermacetogenium phaeum DSM 12270]
MAMSLRTALYTIQRDPERCIACRVCVRQCAYGVHRWDEETGQIISDDDLCVNCHRCVVFCPTKALTVSRTPLEYTDNDNWQRSDIDQIYLQAETGGVLLTGMGNDRPYPIYWDRLLLNASQVTNPSIDPLREPVELKTILGRKPDALELRDGVLKEHLPPQLELDVPIMFSAMSFGAVSLNTHKSLARAAVSEGIYWNCGEGGLHPDLAPYAERLIVQVASGRFGVNVDYLNQAAAVEIKIGQGAKPGIGGHLPGHKVGKEVSRTRMIPLGSDAISPAPHHDIYSIEDLRQLIYSLKEATGYRKPVAVKIAAVHNVAAISSGVVRAGADILVIDGFRGGTGAAPLRIRDNVGIPIELALAAVDTRLREEGIRNQASLVISGGIRNSSDVVKAIALGADAVYLGTAALIALGCHMCQKCYRGKCSWGIATTDPYLAKRLNPDIGARRASNLIRAWKHEIKEMLGGMGINAIESLRGNRLALRGVDLTERELEILQVKAAGE